MTTSPETGRRSPVLLYNDECVVCRRIAAWVERAAVNQSGRTTMDVEPIGGDPDGPLLRGSGLDIWDAYETIHLIMADGSMKVGGEACAEVFRRLPQTHRLARVFELGIFGIRPFQKLLDLGYLVLSDVRPVFGCESCGTPPPWLRPVGWIKRHLARGSAAEAHSLPPPHFTGSSAVRRKAG